MLGTGTQTDPYLIETGQDLIDIQNNPEAYYKLVSDIDLGGQKWTGYNFNGSFDGNGYTISNFIIEGNGSYGLFWELELEYPHDWEEIITESYQPEIKNITFSDFQMISIDYDVNFFQRVEGRILENITFQNVYIEGKNKYEDIRLLNTIQGSQLDNIKIKNITTDGDPLSKFAITDTISSYSGFEGKIDTNINNFTISNINGYLDYYYRGIFASTIKGVFDTQFAGSHVNISNVMMSDINMKSDEGNMNIFCNEIGDNVNIDSVVFKNISMENIDTFSGGCHFSTFGKELTSSHVDISNVYWKDIYISGPIAGVDDIFYSSSGLLFGSINPFSRDYINNINIENIYAQNINFDEVLYFWTTKIGENTTDLTLNNIYVGYPEDSAYENNYTFGQNIFLIGEDLSGNNYQDNMTILSETEMKEENSYVGFDFSNIWGIKTSFNDGLPYIIAMEEPPPTVGKIQFVGEKIIDMVNMLADTMGKKININNEGKLELISKRNLSSLSADYSYSNADNIEWYDAEWDDSDIATRVKVTGRNVEEPRQVVQKEELLVEKEVILEEDQSQKFYYSQDQKTRAVDVRVEVEVADNDSDWFDFYDVITWGILDRDEYKIVAINPYYTEIKFKNSWHFSMDAQYFVKIYGKPVAEVPPGQIEGIAENTNLISKYGEITKEIDNPLLQNFEEVQAKAEEELFYNNIQSKITKVKLLSDVRIQPGKIINVYHPVYQQQVKLYVTEVTHNSVRGSEDSTTVIGYVL